MNSPPALKTIDLIRDSSLDELGTDDEYDFFWGAVGYESRCTYAFSNLLKRNIKFGCCHFFSFDFNQTETTLLNIQQLIDWGVPHSVCSDNGLIESLTKIIHTISSGGKEGTIRGIIDISSFNRSRLACIIECLFARFKCFIELDITFLYSQAQFLKRPSEYSVINQIGPISPFFGMPFSFSDRKFVVMGIGFEPEKALGVLESIEPSDSKIFIPTNGGEFDKSVLESNRILFGVVNKDNLLKYNLFSGSDLCGLLLSLTSYEVTQQPVIIVPLGPKMFTLCSLIVSKMLDGPIYVWRASSAKMDPPIDIQPSGKLALLRVVFKDCTS